MLPGTGTLQSYRPLIHTVIHSGEKSTQPVDNFPGPVDTTRPPTAGQPPVGPSNPQRDTRRSGARDHSGAQPVRRSLRTVDNLRPRRPPAAHTVIESVRPVVHPLDGLSP
ncbi:hypothetical protein GCM10009665_58060 [Kitasatospora nipponensis]|uniref:Uncharacterized protein n=1 Tax=Kitasatospora nipponensis TaxID=258049 RepID=A0ABP4HD95_9ACTN